MCTGDRELGGGEASIFLDDDTSVPSRLAAAMIHAKVRSLAASGVKALPLSVSRCAIEHHGAGSTPFCIVEFRTNYDFAKLSRLQVDGSNTQEIVDGSTEGCDVLWRAAPVLLWPAQGGLVFVFAYVYRYKEALINWSLVNSRGDQVTLLSTVMRDASTDGPEQFSMLIVKGDPKTVLASQVPFDEPESRPSSNVGLPAASMKSRTDCSVMECDHRPSEVARLRHVWSRMDLSEQMSALSFGQDLRPLVVQCRKVVADLHGVARQSVQLGILPSLAKFKLLSTIEFIPDPAGRPDKPLGMMFSKDLVVAIDLWEILEAALPGWGSLRGRRSLLPQARWNSLFEPPPSSWAALETALAALLEQRLLGLLHKVQRSATRDTQRRTLNNEEELVVSRRAPRNQRCGKHKSRNKVAQRASCTPVEKASPKSLSTRADDSTSAQDDGMDTQLCTSEDEPAQEVMVCESTNFGPNEQDADLVENWQHVGPRRRRRVLSKTCDTMASPIHEDRPLPRVSSRDAALQHEQSSLVVDVLAGKLSAQGESTCGSDGADFLSQTLEQDCADELQPRGLAKDELQPRGRDIRSGIPFLESDGCKTQCPGNPVTGNTDRWGNDDFCTQVCRANDEDDVAELERLARGWQSSVWVAEACGGQAGSLWQSRRNENASWRLWHIRQRRLWKGQAPLPFVSNALIEESTCPACTFECDEGKICTCLPNPWQPLKSEESCSMLSGSHIAQSSPGSESKACSESDQLSVQGDQVAELNTHWPSLLRSSPSAIFCAPQRQRQHAYKSAERRRVNAAWRGWWSTHQMDKNEPQYVQSQMLFPATPTSTFPGTPRSSSCEPEDFSGASCGGWTIQQALPQTSPIVFLPVPLQLASQVQDFIQKLAAGDI